MPDYLAFRRVYRNDLLHVGKGHDDNPPGRGSGRYPYGSGSRPYQREKTRYSGVNNYISPMRYKARSEMAWAIKYLASMFIPGLGLVLNTKTIMDVSKQTFDGKDYVKKEGDYEKLSQLKKKDQKMSSSQDVKAVNPRIGNQKGKINNCVNCTVAMEMRSRGYDVIARSSGHGHIITDYLKWFEGFKQNETGLKKEAGESRRQYVDRAYDALCNAIEKEGNGSSGYVGISYDKMLGGSGHAMFWKVEDGKVTFYDGQTGKINPGDIFSLADPSTYRWARLDNLKLKPEITEVVRSNPRTDRKR